MNERIEKLLKQALSEHSPSSWADISQDRLVELLGPFQKKFAELIVRECLTFVEPMPGSGDIDDLALEAARDGIKEHFGVEE